MSAAHAVARREHVHEQARSRWRRRQAMLTLGALGVVYGDIGTSPLYAVRQSVLATGGVMPMPRSDSLLWFAQLWAVRVPESTSNTTPSLPGQ